MSTETKPKDVRGIQLTVNISLILWLALVPVGTFVTFGQILKHTLSPNTSSMLGLTASGILLLPVFGGVAWLARKHGEWQATVAIATSNVVISGALLLDGLLHILLPEPTPAFYGAGAGNAAVRLGVLLPYTLLAAWLAPPRSGAAHRSIWKRLGLDPTSQVPWHTCITTLSLSLCVIALIMLPWTLTGALGDSLTSLSLIFQAVASIIPEVLLLWGIVFYLLDSAFTHSRTGVVTTMILYGVTAIGKACLTNDLTTLWNDIVLVLLLAELRTWRRNVYPLLLVAPCYLAATSLFTDPRDTLSGGIPQVQHLLSYAACWLITASSGPTLWCGRKLIQKLHSRLPIPAWPRPLFAALATIIICGTWGGLYVFAGNPGFYDDGFLIILEEQADLNDAYTISDRETRIQYVYDALTETAEQTQTPLREELDRLGVPYRPYYIINMIRVDGHRWLAKRFQDRPGVAQVILNPNTREYPNYVPLPYPRAGTATGLQPNLAAIQADKAWSLGVTGKGIVVAGQDTGYDWSHPALQSHYRGWDGKQATHDYNWHDSWDDTAIPFDDDSHGTHTMGTILGDDGASNHTGVAPDARWMGCRNMRRGVGNPGSYAECMEFFLAPYPHDGDPFTDGDVRMAPHVINNSWACPYWEGCHTDTLQPAVEALRAAGIMMVVSAGNEGPDCETVTAPPGNYDAVFSIGATRNDGTITDFSSRGPVDTLIKPDVTAPGSGVRSSVPGGGYREGSGTSMAGPHVTGLVALLWSADPDLIGDIDATERIICETAQPKPIQNICTPAPQSLCACGDVTGVPNNVYGCGFIDAGAAVDAVLEKRTGTK